MRRSLSAAIGVLALSALLAVPPDAHAACRRGDLVGTWGVTLYYTIGSFPTALFCTVEVRNRAGRLTARASSCRDERNARRNVIGGSLRVVPRTCEVKGQLRMRPGRLRISSAHLGRSREIFAGVGKTNVGTVRNIVTSFVGIRREVGPRATVTQEGPR